jgi:hypothetical protein
LPDDSSELQPLIHTSEQPIDATPAESQAPQRAPAPPAFTRSPSLLERVSAHLLFTLVVVAALLLQTFNLPDWRLPVVAHAAPPSLPPLSGMAGGVLPAPAPAPAAPTTRDTRGTAANDHPLPRAPQAITYHAARRPLFGIAYGSA